MSMYCVLFYIKGFDQVHNTCRKWHGIERIYTHKSRCKASYINILKDNFESLTLPKSCIQGIYKCLPPSIKNTRYCNLTSLLIYGPSQSRLTFQLRKFFFFSNIWNIRPIPLKIWYNWIQLLWNKLIRTKRKQTRTNWDKWN